MSGTSSSASQRFTLRPLGCAATAVLPRRSRFLDRRAGNVAIGAKHAAIALQRTQDRAAVAAVVEILARVRRHRLGRNTATFGTGEGGLQVRERSVFRHEAGQCPLPAKGSIRRMPDQVRHDGSQRPPCAWRELAADRVRYSAASASASQRVTLRWPHHSSIALSSRQPALCATAAASPGASNSRK